DGPPCPPPPDPAGCHGHAAPVPWHHCRVHLEFRSGRRTREERAERDPAWAGRTPGGRWGAWAHHLKSRGTWHVTARTSKAAPWRSEAAPRYRPPPVPADTVRPP